MCHQRVAIVLAKVLVPGRILSCIAKKDNRYILLVNAHVYDRDPNIILSLVDIICDHILHWGGHARRGAIGLCRSDIRQAMVAGMPSKAAHRVAVEPPPSTLISALRPPVL